MNQKVALACDHRGYAFKEKIKSYLQQKKIQIVDCGTFSEESADYPDFIFKAAEKVASGECPQAIGICHTGIGSSIAANKVRGVRASLCHNAEEAKLTRSHNDSNMLILGSGFLKEKDLIPIVEIWMNTPFEGGRHERRVNQIKDYEQRSKK